jgi:excisionase family DNA binding protein
MSDNELTTLPLMLCVEDLMPILSIGRNRAYKLVRNGEIPSVRIGRLYRIPRSAVVSFIKGKTNEAVSL